jgi:4-hydroxybenzoate polyprenyltransferase
MSLSGTAKTSPAQHNKAMAFMRLIRSGNLLIIVLTGYMIRYLVLHKILRFEGLEPPAHHLLFFLLVLSTALIAAGGYIINDYFDVKTDLINHPETVVLDKAIKRRSAIMLHLVFTFSGLLIGVFVALRCSFIWLALFHLAAATGLWFYSTNFKKQFLTGNLLVSALTAAVAFLPTFFEFGLLEQEQPGFLLNHKGIALEFLRVTWIFAVFAFIISLAREIIKDMEDYRGDEATGARTMPVVWGLMPSRLCAFFLILIVMILLSVVIYHSVLATHHLFSIRIAYIIFFLLVPLLYGAYAILRSRRSKEYGSLSRLMKMLMLSGLFYSIIYYLFE